MDALFYVSLLLAAVAIGSLISSLSFLLLAFLGHRDLRARRLRISLSSTLLFLAAAAVVVWWLYLVQMPAVMRITRPDFTPPYSVWSKLLSVVGPTLLFASAGIVWWALTRKGAVGKRLWLSSVGCLLLALAAGAANYGIVYSIQIPALERYVAIESRDWLTRVGHPAPDVSLTMLDGRTVQLSDLRGKVVLLNFFATWCGPCIAEMPHLEEIWNEWGGNDRFAMLVIGREETPESVTQFQSERGFSFPLAVDPDREAFGKFADEGIPRTYLVSRDGKILYQSIGFAEIDVYQRELARLRRMIHKELIAGQ